MDIKTMLNRVNTAYVMISNVVAKGDELDRIAMARQELRTLYNDLTKAQEEQSKGEKGAAE